MPSVSPACLDENDAVAFVGRALPAEARAHHEAHLDGCSACRRLVSELARGLAPAPRGDDRETTLGRGSTLGRYVLLNVLGAGAMGVVYAAYDPELDRKVALKLLQAGGGEGALLAREARAMARVDHPNVVRVYDAGGEGGRFYFVMEVVEGKTLSEHLRSGARGFREVLGLFVKAGRGLEAAHQAGLVHRDFKPDNVLVGLRGEVRVTDFGLARAPRDGGGLAGAAAPLSGGATTAFAGTPAYMAPEQLRGEAADAKSDQFAFCVALYEALYGERPFAGGDVAGLLAAMDAGALRRPRHGAGVPARVRRALERGLSAAPALRFASMGGLLDALTRDRTRRALFAAALTLAAAAPVAAYGARRARIDAECASSAADVVQAWSEARKARVGAAFEATGAPVAREAFEKVASTLDRYASSLAEMRVASCRATRLRGEQSAELYERRRSCLDDRLGDLDALATQLERADAKTTTYAARAGRELAPVGRCADATALLAPLAEPPELRGRSADMRRRLADARAFAAVGSPREGLAIARRVLAEAESMGHPTLSAEALLRTGEISIDTGDPGAERLLFAAVRAAEEARADLLKARAAERLVYVVGNQEGRYQQALDWADLGLSSLARVGGDDAQASRLLSAKSTVLRLQNKLGEAGEALERAIELAARAGLSERDRAAWLLALANLRSQQRRFGEALGLYDRVLRLNAERAVPFAVDVGYALEGRALIFDDLGDEAAARESYEAAFASLRTSYGPSHEHTLRAAALLIDFEARNDDRAALLPRTLETLATAERHLGPAHDATQQLRLTLGRLLVGLGRPAEAIAPLARVASERGAKFEGGDVQLLPPTRFLGEAELALGHLDRAAGHLERALAIARSWALAVSPLDRGDVALALARARERADRAGSCALAREARDDYGRSLDEAPTQRHARAGASAVDDWLAAHHCPPPDEPGAVARP